MIKTYYDSLTDFIFAEDEPQRADVIFIPGSGYGEPALRAAQLYREGYAQRIVPSGKYSILGEGFAGAVSPQEYAGKIYPTESDFLAQILMDHGVPRDAIWCEREATFTYENALCTRRLLEAHGFFETPVCEGKGTAACGDPETASDEKNEIPRRRAILCCQAYHARRSLMYYQLVFPETEFLVCPAATRGLTRENWYLDEAKIDLVLGEVARCGNQFGDIMKGTDKVWKRREQ